MKGISGTTLSSVFVRGDPVAIWPALSILLLLPPSPSPDPISPSSPSPMTCRSLITSLRTDGETTNGPDRTGGVEAKFQGKKSSYRHCSPITADPNKFGTISAIAVSKHYSLLNKTSILSSPHEVGGADGTYLLPPSLPPSPCI